MIDKSSSQDLFNGALKYLGDDNKGMAIAKMLDAADLEHPEANFLTALFYFTGTGVQRNLVSSAEYAKRYIRLAPNGKFINEAFSIIDETIGTENAKRLLFNSNQPYTPAYKIYRNSKSKNVFLPVIASFFFLILLVSYFYHYKSNQNDSLQRSFNIEKDDKVIDKASDFIDQNKIQEIKGASEKNLRITEMLINFDNPQRMIEIKNEIKLNSVLPEQGDIAQSRALNMLGLEFFKNKDFTQAKNYFLEAHKANPADIEVMNNVGFAYMKLGNSRSAELWIAQTLTYDPGRIIAWTNLGELYSDDNKNDSARASFVVAFNLAENKDKFIANLNYLMLNNEQNIMLKQNIVKCLDYYNKN